MLPAHLAHGSETLSRLGSTDVLIAVAAGVVAVAVALLARAAPPRRGDHPRVTGRGSAGWAVLGVAVLALAIAASRLGRPLEPDNLASVLLPYLLLPVLVILSAAVEAWAPVDPWRTLGAGVDRVAGGTPGEAPPADLRWALLPAVGWTVFAARYSAAVDPRALGTALEIYTFATLAGCAVLGSRRWLQSGEVFGASFDLLARLRARTRLPDHAASLAAVIVVGAVFFRVGGLRAAHTVLGEDSGQPQAMALAAATALVAAGAALALERWGRRGGGGPDSIARALTPAAAALVVAVLIRRALVAAQLLPRLLADPLGQGWRLFDAPRGGVDVALLGDTTQDALALGVVLAGVVTGAVLAAQGLRISAARFPVAVAIGPIAMVCALVVLGT